MQPKSSKLGAPVATAAFHRRQSVLQLGGKSSRQG